MFAACILFALPTIKETWVRADTHPVYNSRVQAIPLGGFGRYGSHWSLIDANMNAIAALKTEMVRDCARYRNKLEETERLLGFEAAKAEPDPTMTEALLKIRARYRDLLEGYAGMLKDYPEMEKRIEDERLKLKQK